MREPRRANAQRRKVAKGVTLPAPTKGWWVADNVAVAPPLTAKVMDNFFPNEDHVRIRRGSEEYATGLTGDVYSLMVYDNGSSAKMFAADATDIYEVTSPGAVGAAKVSSLSNGDWSYVQFTTTGGTYLRLVNGANTPQVFDGSTWGTSPAITGATPTDLKYVWAYRNRLYFIEKNSLDAWYLPVDSIGGAATEFKMGGIFTLGGKLLFGTSWSANLSAQTDEVWIVGTTQGEIAVYSGTYPGDASWKIQGLYRIGKPLGQNCVMRAGGDVAIVTEDGIVPMSKVVSLDRVALANEAITKPIQPAWRHAVAERTGQSGWSITSWQVEGMVVVNLPQIDTNDRTQYIANARTGAWCRYTGWDAKCFGVYNNKLYFGTSDGRVMRGETGGSDDATLYTGAMMWSYTDAKQGPARKHLKAIRPMYRTTYNAAPAFAILLDYDEELPSPPSAITSQPEGAAWDAAVWDTDVWPEGQVAVGSWSWRSVGGIGGVFAPAMQVSIDSTVAPEFDLQQVDVLFEIGEALG